MSRGLRSNRISGETHSGFSKHFLSGSAKMWANVKWAATVPAVAKSSNVSSIIDVDVGRISINMTNAMASEKYPAAGAGRDTDTTRGDCFVGEPNAPDKTTTRWSGDTINASNANEDFPEVYFTVHGDLA